eukprot:2913953-Amphidinium_carterae.1
MEALFGGKEDGASSGKSSVACSSGGPMGAWARDHEYESESKRPRLATPVADPTVVLSRVAQERLHAAFTALESNVGRDHVSALVHNELVQ